MTNKLNNMRKENAMEKQTKGNRQIKTEIFKNINLAWAKIEELEKMATTAFGEDDPTTVSVCFAAIHLMNTSFEIEQQLAASANKLKIQSINQLLEVLCIINWSGAKRNYQIRDAHLEAVISVSRKYDVARTTIADLCVRRLGLDGEGGTERFISLVEGWLLNNETGLREIIKEHAVNIFHQKIDEFFNSGGIIQ